MGGWLCASGFSLLLVLCLEGWRRTRRELWEMRELRIREMVRAMEMAVKLLDRVNAQQQEMHIDSETARVGLMKAKKVKVLCESRKERAYRAANRDMVDYMRAEGFDVSAMGLTV